MLLAEKGATYQVTEEDLNDIANEITADANSVFNQNVTSKTDAFDENATSQTSTFNENVENSITAFNNNATSALSAYNTNHNEKVEAYNTNANTKLEEFNTNASSYDERITDNTNRVKRIENTLYDSGEASGTSINIKDSTLAEFQEISVGGVCKQVTTTGKNLANDNDFKGTIIGGNKTIPNISVNENEVFSITLSQTLNEKGTAGNNNDYIAQHNLKWLDENENVISQGNFLMMTFSSVGETKTLSNTYVAPVDAKYLKLDVGSYFGNSCKLIHNYIQVEKGNVATEYEPYTGGQASPSPSYPQPIEVVDEGFDVVSCAKNFCPTDFNDWESGDYNANGDKTNFLSRIRTIELYPVQPNTKYYCSCNELSGSNYGFIFRGYNNNKVVAKNYGIVGRNASFTTDENIYYLGIVIYSQDDTKAFEDFKTAFADGTIKPLICLDSETDKTFEPYQESIAPIDLKGEFIGKINETDKDQVRLAFNEDDGEYKPKLSKKLKKYTFTGDEIFYKASTNENVSSYFTRVIKDKKTGSNNFKCNHFIYKGNAQWDENLGYAMSFNSVEELKDYMYIQVPNDVVTPGDSEGFMTWFKNTFPSENPLEVYYPLDEPHEYEVDLGVVDMPLSYSPETNVFTTSELEALINAKYYRNFINTIQNLQVNEKALKDELVDIQNQLNTLMANVTNLTSLANVESESEE
jgi:hypothetical protein